MHELGRAIGGVFFLLVTAAVIAFYIAVIAAVFRIFRIHRELRELRAELHAISVRLPSPAPR
jgi:hypothetical protein